MSALQLGCEGLGPGESSGVVYTLQVWVPSPLGSIPSSFLCDCLISPDPHMNLS